jgi:Flp pilus assembly protein TadG
MSVEAEHEHDSDRGAIMVEFALILPILLILLVGIIEFGQAYNTQIALQGAAREGARALALDEDVNAAVNAAAGGIAMTVSPNAGCGGSAPYASVTTSTVFTFSIPFVNLGSRTLDATASMRCGL